MTKEEAKHIVDVAFSVPHAIRRAGENRTYFEDEIREAKGMALKALEQEPLTDTEQRIFLAAMGREEKICREEDEKYPDKVPSEDSLVSVCRSIERKVKKALWE